MGEKKVVGVSRNPGPCFSFERSHVLDGFFRNLNKIQNKQDCSFQGEALNVSTAFQCLWSSYSMKKINMIKINDFF